MIDLRLSARVDEIDAAAREVVLESGERISYGTLVVATGARPRPLPLEGADGSSASTRSARSPTRSPCATRATPTATLVVGASFVGTEVAASLRALGREVTIVEPAWGA